MHLAKILLGIAMVCVGLHNLQNGKVGEHDASAVKD